jgi:hypothetical protein
MTCRLEGLRQDDVIECIIGVVAEIGVCVALDHSQSLGNAFIHAFARQFNAAAVDPAAFTQKPQQFSVATSDVEHFCTALDHLCDQYQVDAGASGRSRHTLDGQIGIGM